MQSLSVLVLLLFLSFATANAQSAVDAAIIDLRLEGRLLEAEAAVKKAMAEPDLSNADATHLHLELATIYDRMALHDGTRPSGRAKEELDRAVELHDPADQALAAVVFYGLARYEYRAELGERLFPQAESLANRSLDLYQEIGDIRAQADVVHLLGLIEMQRRNLDTAGELFERSLMLDQTSGERVLFRGEYERHMGFVVYLRGDVEASLPYFWRSVEARAAAGADDPLVFAKITLASTLEMLDRDLEARSIAEDALLSARRLGSKAAEERIGRVFERWDEEDPTEQ